MRAGFWGAEGPCFAGTGWESAERIPSRQGPGRRRLSVTQFPGLSRRKVEGAGHSSALPPTLGIPQLRAPGGLWRPGSWEPVGAGGEQLLQAGGSPEPNPRRPGLSGSSAGLPARTPPLQVTSGGLAGSRRRAPGPLWGEVRGRAGQPAPPPVNRRFRTFFARPAPFLPLPSRGRVPMRSPLPAPCRGRGLHLCRKWGPSRGHAESEAESPAAALSLAPGPAGGAVGLRIRPCRARLRYRSRAAGRGLQGPDWRWTPTLATPQGAPRGLIP